MIIVSACLLGIKCRYDGSSRSEEQLLSMISDEIFIPVCPEQLGGLTTPRLPAEINEGDGRDVLAGRSQVIDLHGTNVTDQFITGAYETRKIARLVNAKIAIFKEKSPSCGLRSIIRDGQVKEGMGVTTALLTEDGITFISSDRIQQDYVRYRHNRK